MKRIFCLVLLALLLCCGAAQAQMLRHVVDQAGTFTPDTIDRLEKAMQALYDEFNFDSVIVTTNNSRGKTAQLYAADFYDDFRDYYKYPDGVILSLNFDLGDYYEATRGRGMTLLSDLGASNLDRVLRPYFSQKDYGAGAEAYVSYLRTVLAPRTPFQIANSYAPYAAAGGLLIGLAAVLVMKSKIKTARPQPDAQRYVRQGSFNLTQSNDIYLYETVVRTRIQSNSGSSGGGTRFGSSSGHSYGGRGGRL